MKATTEYLDNGVSTKAPKRKIPGLDLMKFMGILIVVYYHCMRVVPECFLTDPSAEQFVFYGVMSLLGPCVPFFFLVTGFLMFDKKLDIGKHLKKTLHFVVLALTWSAITIGVSLWVSPKAEFSLSYIIKHTIFQDTAWYHHMWFMGAMVIFYIFFPLLKSAWDHDRKSLYFFVAACFIITFGNRTLNMVYNIYAWLRYHVNHNPEYNFFSMFNPFRGFDGYLFVYFFLGAIIKEHRERFLEIMKPRLCVLGIILTTGALYLYGYFMTTSTGELWIPGHRYANDILFSTIRHLCIFSLALRYQGTGKLKGLVSYLAANTMGIYLIHYVVRNVTLRAYQAYIDLPGVLLDSFVYFLIVLLITLGIMEIMKRIPGLKKLIS